LVLYLEVGVLPQLILPIHLLFLLQLILLLLLPQLLLPVLQLLSLLLLLLLVLLLVFLLRLLMVLLLVWALLGLVRRVRGGGSSRVGHFLLRLRRSVAPVRRRCLWLRLRRVVWCCDGRRWRRRRLALGVVLRGAGDRRSVPVAGGIRQRGRRAQDVGERDEVQLEAGGGGAAVVALEQRRDRPQHRRQPRRRVARDRRDDAVPHAAVAGGRGAHRVFICGKAPQHSGCITRACSTGAAIGISASDSARARRP
jgi:hypothetical protein